MVASTEGELSSAKRRGTIAKARARTDDQQLIQNATRTCNNAKWLGGTLIPSYRHPMAQASAIATLEVRTRAHWSNARNLGPFCSCRFARTGLSSA